MPSHFSTRGLETPLVILSGILWVVITILGSIGLWFPGILLSIVLMLTLMVLGAAHKGKISVRFLLFPLLLSAAVWAGSFVLAYLDRSIPVEEINERTILGMHPSFAWIVLGYWLAGVATLTGGFYLRKDLWFSEAQWEELKATLSQGENDDA